MEIVPYDPKYRDSFIEMNTEWITKMFVMEDIDRRILEGVDEMVAKGARVYFAIDEAGEPLACCMIQPLEVGEWEIAKFCARGMSSGTGAGSACLKACMDFAQEERIPRIVIVTNHRCEAAIHIYRKFGFRDMPVDKEKFPWERADTAFKQEYPYCR